MRTLTTVVLFVVVATLGWCDQWNVPGDDEVAGQMIQTVDLDLANLPGSNTVAGQLDPNAVIKKPATALGESASTIPWPATADYGGGVSVTAGTVYNALDTFWSDETGAITAKPTWARTAIVGIGGVSVHSDGRFVARGDGFVLIQWWDTRTTRIWVSSTPVFVK